MDQPVLHTDRLRLEPLSMEHLSDEVRLDTDPVVMQFVGGPSSDVHHVRRAHARRIGLSGRRAGLGFWMAYSDSGLVGLMMLPPAHGPDQPDDPDTADLGYRLAPSAWGKGYGREAATRLLAHAFDTVGMHRVLAQTRSDNIRSRALLEAIGMRHVRDFRSLDDPSDGPLDSEYDMSHTGWGRIHAEH